MQIRSIQALRAIAASAVVLIHANNRVEEAWPHSAALLTDGRLHAGHAGVDLFFVISGFLMAYLHREHFGRDGAPQAFLSKRLVRIVPIYWLLSGFALVLAIAIPHLFGGDRHIDDWSWLIGNFAFVPLPDDTGNTTRLLVVGWTLDYEMLFYVMFTAALFFRRGLVMLCAVMLGAVAAGRIWQPAHPVLDWLTSRMLLEFLMGVGVAWMVRAYRAPAGWAWALLGLSIGGLVLAGYAGGPRWLVWGVPAASVVLACLWLGFACEGPVGRMLCVAGDASYSIYLTQVFSLPALTIAAKMAGIRLQGDVMIVALWLGACALGVVFWWSVEKRITELLKRAVIAPRRLAAVNGS